ncbi:hypothetical protein ACHAPT_011556 [Fusarium lateritium]
MQSNSSCQTCRTRRIKCDGAKPICQKCIKSRRTCVEADAAKQQLFAIHIENQYAAGEKRRPRGPRSTLVPIHVNFDLKTRAHAYYVQNHFQVFQDMPDVVVTWAECLHEWKAKGKSSPIVDLAFSAVTLSVFARFQNCRPAAAEASKSYLSLLRHMQNRILRLNGSPASDDIDEYLLGAHFMARYEAFVQNHGDEADLEPLNEVKVWFHIDGAAAILKICAVWNEYYAIRMLVSHTRLQILQLAAQSNSAETLECLTQLGSSAESLASLVPFCLGRIRRTPTGSIEISNEPFKPYLASLVVWPMSLASSLHTLEPTQRQWFSSTLARVSKESSECLYAYAASDYWAVV